MNALGWRSTARQRLENEMLDLLIIGGGIVGAGVVRDAALRGLKVGLIDQHDFAEGTSSRSSRLLHGGLRYLEQGRVFLVREASIEKKIVQQIAPHLVQPLGFVFPAYRGQGRPLWQLKIGVKLYDWLCKGKNFKPSRGLTAQEALSYLPGLRSEKLTGAAYYFDALTNDARLVIDSIHSGVIQGATVANYTQLINARRDQGVWLAEVLDRESGENYCIQSRTIVNATGPWADRLPISSVRLRLSKGIHMVLSRDRLPVTAAAVMTEGKRILFVIPWGQRVIVGTTDTDYEGAPEAVRTTEPDIQYVLQTLGSFFPAAAISPKDILAVWAGLRPLIANPNGSPSDISRAHQILSPAPGWWDVTGGKLTTYRLMAEQTVDNIFRDLGRRSPPCHTAVEPLLPDTNPQFSGMEPAPWSQQAVEHYCRREWAIHLDDVMIRRAGWLNQQLVTTQQQEQLADWMGALLNWSSQQRQTELSRAAQIIEERDPKLLSTS